MERDRDEQIEVELAPVVGGELAADTVDLAGVELGHELDLLLGEQAAEMLGGDRLREGAVERRHVDELGLAAELPLTQVPVGQEGELERSDRALDRHVDEVDDQPAAVEAVEGLPELTGSLGAVEGEGPVVPAGPGEALGLLGLKPAAGCDDQDVVGEHGPIVEEDLVALDPDLRDLVLMEDDAVVELPAAWPHDLVELREPEWHEEQAGLVDVPVILVDDVDLGLVGVEAAAQPVSRHRAAGAATEDHDLPPPHSGPPASSTARPPTPRLIVSSNSNPASIERRSGQAAATSPTLRSARL